MLWVIVAAFTALALLTGGVALLRTRRANRIAGDAIVRAREANQLAEAANRLSKEANEISRRALDVRTEQHVVDWEPNWHRDIHTLVLRQLGADDAYQVTVIVTGKDLHEVRRIPQVAPGEQVSFDLPQVVELRRKHEAEQAAAQASLSGASMVYFAGPFSITLKIIVAWVSAAGLPKTATLPDLRVR